MIGAGADGSGPTAGGRLLLRRPTPDDLDDVFRIHGDELTNAHNPAGPDDRDASRQRLECRPDLEIEDDADRVVILVTRWPTE
jgi:hypothetical protein